MLLYFTIFVPNDIIINTNGPKKKLQLTKSDILYLATFLSPKIPLLNRGIFSLFRRETYRIFAIVNTGTCVPLPNSAPLPSQQPTSWSNRDL